LHGKRLRKRRREENVRRTQIKSDKAWVKGVTSLKPSQSWKNRGLAMKTLLPSSNAATNLPSASCQPFHSARVTHSSGLPLPQSIKAPLNFAVKRFRRRCWLPPCFLGSKEKILHCPCEIF